MDIDTKKMSRLICKMLMDGYRQHYDLADKEFIRLNNFCSERANNLAMAMPELIEECRDLRQTPEEAAAQVNHYTARTIARFLGVEPGDYLP